MNDTEVYDFCFVCSPCIFLRIYDGEIYWVFSNLQMYTWISRAWHFHQVDSLFLCKCARRCIYFVLSILLLSCYLSLRFVLLRWENTHWYLHAWARYIWISKFLMNKRNNSLLILNVRTISSALLHDGFFYKNNPFYRTSTDYFAKKN